MAPGGSRTQQDLADALGSLLDDAEGDLSPAAARALRHDAPRTDVTTVSLGRGLRRHPSGSTTNPVLLHLDEVHLDVLRGGA